MYMLMYMYVYICVYVCIYVYNEYKCAFAHICFESVYI